jgi:hypothetical protein
MFLQIFLFEIKYRLRRPAFYLFFFFGLIFAILNFANGAVPTIEKEVVNAPGVLAIFSAAASIFLMLVSSSIMGVPLYRDIEHNTKEYYLSYPITKAGYFWGRWLGSFLFVVLISIGVLLGAWLGTHIGPAFGLSGADSYGPNHFNYYFYPFLTLILPNIFFTSALFFGLVAVFKNVKVIYSSGLFLFLGYIIANFFLSNINNPKVIYLTDPFLMNGLRAATAGASAQQLNSSVIHIQGLMLTNRIIWISVGAVILLLTYLRFSFERFFSGNHGRRIIAPGNPPPRTRLQSKFRPVDIVLNQSWHRRTWLSLTRIELLNIIRDNYFWIILSGGLIFLSFVFYHGPGGFRVFDYPRTAFFMDVFGNVFSYFVFFIIIFYTGETVHRERITRYSYINDALPPPTWILNLSKLTSLCCLAAFLAIVPVLLGVGVQIAKGFYQFNFPLYGAAFSSYLLPQMLEMVLFSYTVHLVVNNKFAAHAIGITIWVVMVLLSQFHYFEYNLLLFGHTSLAMFTDMDGIGHLLKPLLWFQSYWLIAGALMVVLSSIFYTRGLSSTLKEKRQLAMERFRGPTRWGSTILVIVLLATGGFIYYNVSYLNEYYTQSEQHKRTAIEEQQLKHFGSLPQPWITRIRLAAELFPNEQRASSHVWLTIANKTNRPIDTLLLDGDNLSSYDLIYNDQHLSYTNPLSLPRGKFNFLRHNPEPSDYRLYILPTPLLPGDTARAEVISEKSNEGFQNNLYALGMLRNGFVYNAGLPGLGYDEGEELDNNDVRKKYGLPEKHEKDIPHDDSTARRTPQSQVNADLIDLDITVSTNADQWVVAPGVLEKEWITEGRHYFHYVQDHPIYPPFLMVSARYAINRDTVVLQDGSPVGLAVFYDPKNGANSDRFMTALRDGIQSCSRRYGPYPFHQMRLAETSFFGPAMRSFAQTIVNTERVGWNADMRAPGLQDNIYYITTAAVAEQWWGQQVVPNHTVGSRIISEGLPKYVALMLTKHKYGDKGLSDQMDRWRNDFYWGRRTNWGPEPDLLHANKWFQYSAKPALVLYGLQGLIGEDTVDAALRTFKEKFAFRSGGFYAGTEDLYQALEAHTPDTLRYFLEDSWKKVCLYDNKILSATTTPLGRDRYKIRVELDIRKIYYDSTGKEEPATHMNDYIDVGVNGKEATALYLHRYKFPAGTHTLEITVDSKPTAVQIDPHGYLLSANPSPQHAL